MRNSGIFPFPWNNSRGFPANSAGFPLEKQNSHILPAWNAEKGGFKAVWDIMDDKISGYDGIIGSGIGWDLLIPELIKRDPGNLGRERSP